MSAVYTQIANAVLTTIRGLTLSGLSSSQILLLEAPLADRAPAPVGLPCVQLSKAAIGKRLPGGTNASDDIGYPTYLQVADVPSRGPAFNSRQEEWCEAIQRAFHFKRLAGVALVYNCKVEPGPTVDQAQFRDRGQTLGTMTIWAITRELR